MVEKVVLAVDPGTAKCGMALVKRLDSQSLEVMWRSIVPTGDIIGALEEAFAVSPAEMVIVGSGTHSRPIVHAIRDHKPSLGILVVDERDTSMQARERYWEHNPRRGWRRFLPSTMLTPPDPVDDFVAVILAERVLLG